MELNRSSDESDNAIDIDMGKHNISYSYIETNSLSTCLGILLDGSIENKKFCFLWHTPELNEDSDDNLYDLLIYLLGKIVDYLKEDLAMFSLSSEPNTINNLTLLIAGGTVDEHILTRKAYALLNQNIDLNLIETLTENIDIIYLLKKLQNSVIIIKPVTYVLQDDIEDEGADNIKIYDPPGIWLKYNCLSTTGRLGVEWVEPPMCVDMASMFIRNLKNNDVNQYTWKWNQENILAAKQKLINDDGQLQAFTQSADFVFKQINLNMGQSWGKQGEDYVIDFEFGLAKPIINRDEEIYCCLQVLSRQTKNNPILVGKIGVGKTAIVEDLAQRIVHQDVSDTLPKRLITLNMETLVAGTSQRDEFEERFKIILEEMKNSNIETILYIDKLNLVFVAGEQIGTSNAANLLKATLAQGGLRCIGTLTLDEYRKYIEKDPVFERHFQHVSVKELTVDGCISILRGVKDYYELHFGVRILDSALVITAELSNCYITNRSLPAKAIDLIDEACANIHMQLNSRPEIINQLERRKVQLNDEASALEQKNDEASKEHSKQVKEELTTIQDKLKSLKLRYKSEKKRVNKFKKLKRQLKNLQVQMARAEREKNLALVADMKYRAIPDLEKKIAQTEHRITEENKQQQDDLLTELVGPNAIAEIVSRWTGIPVTKLSQTERDRSLKLSEYLHKNVVGQVDAIDSVVKAIFRNRAQLSRSNQPNGSFLFLGPTGVGKTELAEILALELFDLKKSIIRIDMNEYTEPHSIARLIGTPSGYVGFEQDGQLTDAVRRQPYTLILFDEVEKAHPQIWNVLSQILNSGCLTDGKGRTIDFTNTIIILTSNIGAQYILKEVENSSLVTKTSDGKLSQTIRDHVMKEIHVHFRPEFLNHLDNIVFFQPLNIEQIRSIINLQIELLEHHLKEQHITISLTDKAIQLIIKNFYNPVDGVRRLKHHFEEYITTELSKFLFQMKVVSHQHVIIDIDANEQCQFHIEQSTIVNTTSTNTTDNCHEYDEENYNDEKYLLESSAKRLKQSKE